MKIVKSDRPTVYADANVFRYVAHRELTIQGSERYQFVYSHVHLDEIHVGQNRDALDGMRKMCAVEIEDVLNGRFQSIDNVRLCEYVDPAVRYQQHLSALSGYEDASDSLMEPLARLFGADNFQELSRTPEKMIAEVDRLTEAVDRSDREELQSRAHRVAIEMRQGIDAHLKERMPIDQTRSAFGLTSESRSTAAQSARPIDSLFEAMGKLPGGLDKDQLLGLKPSPGIHGGAQAQNCAVAGAYVALNVLGLSADKRLTKPDRLRRSVSDSQHVGMASYCNVLLSADRLLCEKAKAIYIHMGLAVRALYFEHNPAGTVVDLSGHS